MEQFHGTTIVSRAARQAASRSAATARSRWATSSSRRARARCARCTSDKVLRRVSPAAPPTRSRCSSASRPSSKSTRATCCARRSSWPRTGAPTACCAGSKRCCRGRPRGFARSSPATATCSSPSTGIGRDRRGRRRMRRRRRKRAAREHASCRPTEIVKKALTIAGDLCIYTNQHHMIEVLE